jgi:tripartite-type tricarboxylate transporter receptor subunit TctC
MSQSRRGATGMRMQKVLFCITLLSPFFSFAVAAQAYPARSIALVVGYTPGGSVDLAARLIAPELSKRLGQPVVIENAGGAGGQIGAQKVVSAPADGYTILLGTSAEVSVARLINPVVRYDGMTDLVALGLIGTQPMVLTGGPSVKAADTQALLEDLSKRPGKLSYGSAGPGSLPHLAGELFKQKTRTYIVHVPYRGAAPMMTDLMGGQVDLGMLVLSSAMAQAKSGKLKFYGVTESRRATQMPGVPALAETPGLEGFDLSVFFGLFARAKTPIEIQQRIGRELLEVLKLPDVQSKLAEAGFTVRSLNTAEATRFVGAQADSYRRIVEASKIRE